MERTKVIDTRRDWQGRVVEWANDRNLIEGSTPRKQWQKLREEVYELRDGIIDGNTEEIEDAIGDCCVVLCIIATQCGIDLDAAQESAWMQIKDRTGKMVDGVFVKDE